RARELIAKAHNARIRTTTATERFAWFLLTCPDKSFRDPQAARGLLQSVVLTNPLHRAGWQSLSLACCRLGKLEKARQALVMADRARGKVALEQPDDAADLFARAIVEWQTGNHDAAQQAFKRANNA